MKRLKGVGKVVAAALSGIMFVSAPISKPVSKNSDLETENSTTIERNIDDETLGLLEDVLSEDDYSDYDESDDYDISDEELYDTRNHD